MKYLFTLISFTLIFTACNNAGNQSESEEQSSDAMKSESSSETCTYAFNKANTKVAWTAYKTTEKIGVGGEFTEFEVSIPESGSSITEAVNGVEFKIPVSSTETKNEDRNMKIINSFFGVLTGTDHITGQITSMNGDEKSGTASVELNINSMSNSIDMDYTVENETITLSQDIDVTKWNAQSGIDSLNTVCYDLHKGADGVSKLWPNVSLSISSTFNKDCQTAQLP